MQKTLTMRELDGYFEAIEKGAFRLEVRDLYRTPGEAKEFQSFLSGERTPRQINLGWTDFVRQGVQAHRRFSRIHIVTVPLTPYLHFEIDWGYRFSAEAGEEILIVDRAVLPNELRALCDFWLFDSSQLVRMDYASDGSFSNAVLDDDPSQISYYQHAIEALVPLSNPVKNYQSDHPLGV